MPKSKEMLDSEDDLSSGEEKPTKKRQRVEKKKDNDKKEESKSKPTAKASKKTKNDSDEENSNDKPDDDGKYSLGKMKFVSVSDFKGKAYVNIREYYEKDGKTLPGKKGISLAVEQWESLKRQMDKIDADLKNF